MSSEGDLQAPVLLIAMPQVLDPFFHRSVVLLVHHQGEGSLGFIVNRPTAIPVVDILKGMEITWSGAADAVAYFGGPVQPQLGTVLFAHGDGREAPDEAAAVAPGVTLTQQVDVLSTLANDPPERFRLCLGYAGWGAGQLLEEILRNDWLTAPVEPALVFAPDPATAWAAALASVGVDPSALPSWSPAGGGEGAN